MALKRTAATLALLAVLGLGACATDNNKDLKNAEAEWTVEALGEFLWPTGSEPVE